jgi:16S rRNA (adenine1518-N6/adenine1519-N6)-dimethyltransferase
MSAAARSMSGSSIRDDKLFIHPRDALATGRGFFDAWYNLPMNLSSPATIHGLLKKHNLRPRKRFGQNFLVDGNTLARIVDAAGLGAGDRALEIGTGLGVLTRALAEAVGEAGQVVTIEVDTDLAAVQSETLQGLSQVTPVHADALDLDWPGFFAEKFVGAGKISVVANIPYNITTPLITRMLENKARVAVIVLLVQKEVAERLAAAHGTPNYGSVSVFVQAQAKVETVSIVSRKVFNPQPDVESAIIRLTPHHESPVPMPDPDFYFGIVRASFGQRRKSLLNALSGDPRLLWDRDTARGVLDRAGIDSQKRGETLSLGEFAALTEAAIALGAPRPIFRPGDAE